ncbi:MAG: hypothetical protein EHM61_18340 [Acidobacteria bacterium]|nr:MAG: hypothetical protein EHM61_18340 [Acidobacteriota bacterium]
MESETVTLKQFPCQQCGARLDFAPGTAALRCPYCSFENQIPQSQEEIRELDYLAQLAELAGTQETVEAERLQCGKCAAETTLPTGVVSGTCPFCGSNLVATGRSKRLVKPKSLLPFGIAQRQAFDAFQGWINGLWFAPTALKNYAQSEGRLSGVYVPFWTYDCRTTSFYTGQRGDDYWTTETYRTTENGRSVTKTRRVKHTRWTSVSGTVWESFDDVLVPASDSLPGECLQKLEPWDLERLVPFADEYLSGFRAESYRVSLEDGFGKAKEIMDLAIRSSVARDIGGDQQRIHSVRTQCDGVTFKHILLPVWLSAYRFKEKVFRFLVNARTGEVQGERPWSAWKITALVLTILIVILVLVLVFQE